jgi:hypothetical protein
MSSWVKLSRKLATSAIAAKPEYLAVWVHLLMAAAYKEGEILVGRQVVRLKPGQLVFGRHKFSEKTGVSENIVRSALKVLESLQQITIKSESKFSVITITKWAHYQTEEPADNQQRTSNAPATHHNKEIQEEQEEDQKPLSPDEPDEPDEPGKGSRIPLQEILDLYHQKLPSLPRVLLFDDARKKAIRGRWNAHPKCRSLDFWARFFDQVARSDFLMGRTRDPWNGCCFDWIFKPANFKKIVEGNYNREA